MLPMDATPKKYEYDDYVTSGYLAAKDRQLCFTGESSDFLAEYKVRKLREWLPDFAVRPIAVLDYGCGGGWMTVFVKKYFPQAAVCGIDPSAKSIEYGREHYPEIAFECVQEAKLPFAPQSFDLAFASGVVHHIPFNEHRTYLDELFKTLKPGGKFVLFELNPWNPFSVLVFKRSPFDRNARLLYPRYAKQLLGAYGTVRTKYYAFFPRFLRWLRPLEPLLERIPLGALYASIVDVPGAHQEKSNP